ncbi:OmpA family protein [uncultured Microscilla sp.]|uniref:OmpA family protein n=1 Tax=uncultured Microscilla sp. TaxID=432653 RepID=UPI00260FCF40|nr:OmpA family protein [uncultured Microscilla sp.]
MKKLLCILWAVMACLPTLAQNDDINYLKNIEYYKAEDLGENVNSKSDESYPVISPDGKILYFTREGHPGNTEYKYDKRDQDIWYATMAAGGVWSLAKNLGKPVNEGYRSLVNAPNNNTLIVWGAPKGYTGVKVSKRTTDGWTTPENFYRHKTRKNAKGENIFVGNDLQTMLISRKGDIFVLFKAPDGSWSEPKSLGATINTKAIESIAFLAPDNVTLYFASVGHPGFGGSDLYLSRRLDDSWQKWSTPLNLGPSINTQESESGLYLPASGEYAYFHRESRRRNREIFRVKLHEKLRPTPVVLITGRVLDAKTKKPIGTAISYRHLAKNTEVGVSSSDPKSGNYEVTLPARHKYGYFATKKGYYPISENIDLTGLKNYKEIKVDLFVTPIEKGVKILLNNLFFGVSSSKIESTSFDELNRLVRTLNEYPKMVIQLNGHTDNQGGATRNQLLSQHRARSVRNYLANKGIARNRIKVKGFGASQPIADNNTQKGRIRNRRVEFEVLEF